MAKMLARLTYRKAVEGSLKRLRLDRIDVTSSTRPIRWCLSMHRLKLWRTCN
jgi:aryl-alcohol dehydrogenase-like predicted oxidoreductase